MIDEEQLESLIDFAGPNGEMAHRFIYHVLCQLRSMGYQHRDDWKVILTTGDHEGEISEAYGDYLDRKACGESVWFNPDGDGEVLFEAPVEIDTDEEE
jgi:hypothetical protein